MSDSGSPEKNVLMGSSLKPQEKNLLDNVSLMTTLSPMPSNDTSLQPHGTSTQELLDGVFGNVQETMLPETMDDNPISTFAEMQAKLRAQLDGDSTAGSAGVDSNNGRIMYGFDLSPIHSVDKASVYTTTQEEPPTTEKLNKRGNLNVSRNFIQTKGSSHLSKSGKSTADNDTETMMSQVFSSQDVVSSANGIDQSKTKRNVHSAVSDQSIRSSRTLINNKKVQNNTHAQRAPSGPFSMKQKTLRDTPNKKSSKDEVLSPKSTTRKPKKTPEVVLPKSPPSRQATVRVTPRIKTKSPKKAPSVKSKQDTHDLPVSAANISNSVRREKSQKKSSERPVARNISGGKQNHDETVSLIHILEDLNEMRFQVADSQKKSHAVSQENDELIKDKKNLEIEITEIKKENFVLRSRLEKFTALGHPATAGSAVENISENVKHDQEEVERLLIGYQKENERIYGDLKKLKQSNKDAEQAMYEENLRWKSEIAQLKEELGLQIAMNKARGGVTSKSEMLNDNSGAGNDDAAILQKKIESLQHQVKTEEGFKIKSDMLVRKLTEERNAAEKKIVDNNCRYEETHDKLVMKHKADIAKLESELEKARRSLNGKADTAITIRDIMSTPPSKSLLTHFQKRVKKLEEELKNQDTQANNVVASVQKQYSDIKLKYEERIDDLEKQIQLFRKNAESQGHNINEQNLKRQLSEALSQLKVEADQRKMERDTLFEQINALRQQQSTSTEASLKDRKNAAAITAECQRKDEEITRLNVMLDKLKNGRPKSSLPARVPNEKKRRQAYNPGSFEGEGYASLVDMNGQLKNLLQEKELELKHIAITKDATIAKLEQDLKTQKIDYEKEVSNRKNEVQSQSVPENSMKFRIGQLETELQSRCVEITNLRSELGEMSVSKMREQALQSQVQQLLMQVREARTTSPSSATRRIATLEDKLRVLEEKLKIRELEMRRLQFENSSSDLVSELRSAQVELERKNIEMTKFRLELDSILLVLKELHSQGVKIPLPNYLHSVF